jgi:hypothetical protein
MSNMFKKTLVAVALTAYASGSYAVTVGTNNTPNTAPAVASTEYVAAQVAQSTPANRIVTLPAGLVTFTPGVDYVAGDIVEISFSGATLATGITPTITPGAAGALAYQGVSASNSNTLVFAVTTGFASGAANQFSLGAVSLQAATVTGNVTVSYRATNSSGSVIKDNFGDTSRVVLTTRSQYSASISQVLDAKVNTATRSRFVGTSTPVVASELVQDTFKFKVANRETITPATAGVWANSLVLTDVNRLNVTIDGPFSSFTNAAGTRQDVVTCANTGAVAASNETVAADVGSKLVLRYEAAALGAPNFTAETTCTFDVTPVTSNLPLTEFKTSLQFAATAANRFTVSNLDTGKFSLDGSVITIPYMPYGDTITQVINLTSTASASGNITVEAVDRTGAKYGPVSVGTALPNRQVALADAIKTELLKAGMPANERAQLTLVVNVPASQVNVYSAYNTSGNGARIVVNSSNGK